MSQQAASDMREALIESVMRSLAEVLGAEVAQYRYWNDPQFHAGVYWLAQSGWWPDTKTSSSSRAPCRLH